MASFIVNAEAQTMLEKSDFYAGVSKIKLHTGNPGKLGTENKAKEEKEKEIKAKEEGWTVGARVIQNLNAIEWAEVSETEEYKFFSLWVGGVFKGYGEFTAAVKVEKGDTFKINVANLKIEIEE